MLNFAICDDSLSIINQLTNLFENLFFKHDYPAKVVFTTTKANDLLSFVSNNKIDVLVLDINLHSNIDGLGVAKKIREFDKDCYIIFTTAHMEFAPVAYKYKTFDYISKPINSQRIEESLFRLFNDIKRCY